MSALSRSGEWQEVSGPPFRVWGLGFRVWSLRFRVPFSTDSRNVREYYKGLNNYKCNGSISLYKYSIWYLKWTSK